MDPTRLATIPLFSELTVDQQSFVAGACSELRIEAGATLVRKTPMELVTVLNRNLWKLEESAPEVGAALRTRIAEHFQVA